MNPPHIASSLAEGCAQDAAADDELHPGPRESLKQVYDRYFQVVLANTEDLREWSYRLRYQVYCIENEYEPIRENPGERETDRHDAQSMHSLLVHHSTGTVVGTTRLILPQLNDAAIPIPIQTLCPPDILDPYADRIQAGRAGELSRFAIARGFRRRAEDKESIAGGLSIPDVHNQRRIIPHISLGLMQSAHAMARIHGITHLYAVMEPALLRMLRHLGIYFENIGPVVDFHGRRQPCFCDIEQLLARTWEERPDVWEILTDGGRLSPRPSEEKLASAG